MEKRPDLSTLTEQEKDALIITLFDVIESLRLQIRQQADDIEKLKEQLDKNSRNSSKPPSSDGLSKSLFRKPQGSPVPIIQVDNKGTKVITLKPFLYQILLNLIPLGSANRALPA
ncbi:MAG: hypothetical protein GQ475_02400 [Methylococcaceae bacterium]|nr:hypothetical protein [Methylococcaceae bacterium]